MEQAQIDKPCLTDNRQTHVENWSYEVAGVEQQWCEIKDCQCKVKPSPANTLCAYTPARYPGTIDRTYLDLPVGRAAGGGAFIPTTIDSRSIRAYELAILGDGRGLQTDYDDYHGELRIHECLITIIVAVDIANSGSNLPLTINN